MSAVISMADQSGSSLLTSRSNGSKDSHKKRPYKVVFESVLQEKKSLRSAVSYNAEAPPGYTFVPTGNPELTDYCKEFSRTRGLKVYIVSAPPKNKAHKNPENISHHIHRIGHHFDNHIVDKACDWLGIRSHGRTYARVSGGGILPNSVLARRLASHSKRLGLPDQDVTFQQRNQQVRETIRDLFPRIPEPDIDSIITRAFEEGTSRVGNAEELSLPRRVQLATVAHIRHTYTDYDQLLRSGSYHQARAKVEQACLDRLVRWRGENDSDVKEVEDIFREVIVLDDDSDTEEPLEADTDVREPSIEIVYTQALPTDLQPDRPESAVRRTGEVHARSPARYIALPRRELPPLASNVIAERYNKARARHRLAGDVRVISPVPFQHLKQPLVSGANISQDDRHRAMEARYVTDGDDFVNTPTRDQVERIRMSTIPVHDSYSYYPVPNEPHLSRPIYVPAGRATSDYKIPASDERHNRTNLAALPPRSNVVYQSIERPPDLNPTRQQPDRTVKRKFVQKAIPPSSIQSGPNHIGRSPKRQRIFSDHINNSVVTYPSEDVLDSRRIIETPQNFIDLTNNSPIQDRHEYNFRTQPAQRISRAMERLQLVDNGPRYDLRPLQQSNSRLYDESRHENLQVTDRLYTVRPQASSPYQRFELQQIQDHRGLSGLQYTESARRSSPLTFHEALDRSFQNNGRSPFHFSDTLSPRTNLSDVYQFRGRPMGSTHTFQEIPQRTNWEPRYVGIREGPRYIDESSRGRTLHVQRDHP